MCFGDDRIRGPSKPYRNGSKRTVFGPIWRHGSADRPNLTETDPNGSFSVRSGDTAPRIVQTLPKRSQTDCFRSDQETRFSGLSKLYRNGFKRTVFGPIRRHGSTDCPNLTETDPNGRECDVFSSRSRVQLLDLAVARFLLASIKAYQCPKNTCRPMFLSHWVMNEFIPKMLKMHAGTCF